MTIIKIDPLTGKELPHTSKITYSCLVIIVGGFLFVLSETQFSFELASIGASMILLGFFFMIFGPKYDYKRWHRERAVLLQEGYTPETYRVLKGSTQTVLNILKLFLQFFGLLYLGIMNWLNFQNNDLWFWIFGILGGLILILGFIMWKKQNDLFLDKDSVKKDTNKQFETYIPPKGVNFAPTPEISGPKKPCPECGYLMSATANKCDTCGYLIPIESNPSNNKI